MVSLCEFVSVGHVWTPISSSACSVCSFLFFFTLINIFCFQQVMSPQSPSPTYHHPIAALYTRAASTSLLSRFAQTRHAPPYDSKYCVLLTATYRSLRITLPQFREAVKPHCETSIHTSNYLPQILQRRIPIHNLDLHNPQYGVSMLQN
jgi:RNase adaptor protein for sRNA GlmZ degradation